MKLFNKAASITLFILILLATLVAASPLQLKLEQTTGLQWLFQWRGPIEPPDDIVVIALNNAVSTKLGLPSQVVRWPRTLHAQVVQQLTLLGARLIVMDIAFKEPKGEQDRHFADALDDADNVVLFKYLKRNQTPLIGANGLNGVLDIEQEIPPLALFAQHALAVGSFTLTKNPGTVVQAPTYMHLAQGIEPTQPLLALLSNYRKELPELLRHINAIAPESFNVLHTTTEPADTSLNTTARYLAQRFMNEPLLPEQLQQRLSNQHTVQPTLTTLINALAQARAIYINFYGPDRTLTTINLDQLLQPTSETPLPSLQGKTVFVGFSENAQTEQKDFYRTVYSQRNGIDLSGVEISATTYSNLQHNSWIVPAPVVLQCSLVAMALTLGMVSFLRLPITMALGLQILLATLYCMAALQLFNRHQLWLPLFTPLIALLVANSCALYLRYRYNRQRHQHIEHALSHYLPAAMAQQLSQNVEHLEQQHQLVQGICLMTDIHGYTRVSEQLPPTELHRQLNRYYETLIDAVNQHGGNVANIVGDSLLAIWTAPTLNQEICEQAVSAATAIADKINQLSDENIQLPTSIALHGGEFSLGNLGAKNHFEYSPVGDIVNTTARIEHLNRDLGTQILCTNPLRERLPQSNCRYMGQFALRNKAAPVALFELTPHSQHPHEQQQAFKTALQHFEQQDFTNSKVLFTEYTHLYPNDRAGAYYLSQCQIHTDVAT